MFAYTTLSTDLSRILRRIFGTKEAEHDRVALHFATRSCMNLYSSQIVSIVIKLGEGNEPNMQRVCVGYTRKSYSLARINQDKIF